LYLINNSFKLPKGLIPYNNSFEFKDEKDGLFEIEDLDKKSADEVYNENNKTSKEKEKDSIGTTGKVDLMNISTGMGRKKANGNGKDERKEQAELKKKWKKVFGEASVYAKQQGKLPVGIDRLIDIVLNEKISWKSLLYKYITNELPFDYTYCLDENTKIKTGDLFQLGNHFLICGNSHEKETLNTLMKNKKDQHNIQ